MDADLTLVGLGRESFGLPFLVRDVAQAFFQRSDLAEPLHPAGFGQPFLSVILDLQQARDLGEGEPEHGTSDACLTEMILMLRGRLDGHAHTESNEKES
jgi:hypothetical protein